MKKTKEQLAIERSPFENEQRCVIYGWDAALQNIDWEEINSEVNEFIMTTYRTSAPSGPLTLLDAKDIIVDFIKSKLQP